MKTVLSVHEKFKILKALKMFVCKLNILHVCNTHSYSKQIGNDNVLYEAN